MSALSNTCTGTYETSSPRLAGFRKLFSAVVREIRIRRALREVSSLDDAMLHDIGLGLGSIEDAVRHGRC